MMKHFLWLFISLFIFCLLSAGCPPPTTPGNQDTLDLVKQRGTLIVLLGAEYPPFNVLDTTGKAVGLDVDIAQEIANDMQVTLDIQVLPWDGMLAFFSTGKGDLIIDGISITEERQKVLDFSDPYYRVGQVILKRKGDTRIQSYRDLNQAKFKIACQMGATSHKAITELMPQATPLFFQQPDEGASALKQGFVDALIMDDPWIKVYLHEQESGETLEGILEPFTDEPIGIPVRKDSPKMLQQVNKTLKRLKDSGAYQHLLEKYDLVVD
ncbi:MAG: amino acid ABC transporter substrate-binding protein [Deltaproteobacteria bacterium]|nr:amino acid ABC transporter substrate-binding protein [Deltaproteobacteria bacterium]